LTLSELIDTHQIELHDSARDWMHCTGFF